MSDNTMPERLWAQYNRDDDTSVEYNAWHTHDDKFTETEYIRADVAQAQLDAANARIAELEAVLRKCISVVDSHHDTLTDARVWSNNDTATMAIAVGLLPEWTPPPVTPDTP